MAEELRVLAGLAAGKVLVAQRDGTAWMLATRRMAATETWDGEEQRIDVRTVVSLLNARWVKAEEIGSRLACTLTAEGRAAYDRAPRDAS